ncbi:hypothetical protein NDU88_003050 [Pleurodeles waltl]|uniref:Uncharacterized protein n=1 Tax=Pleurodeles waltl TaxID=8319 RepID=A0AAV7RDR8_PLEWA|nr:hypothetical protein NDU88_003050 [Pleurodeles waltl]
MLCATSEYLEACSCRNNVSIVGIAESTRVENMERYMEQLLIDLLGRKTFSELFLIEQAHRSLTPRPGKRRFHQLKLDYNIDYVAQLRVMMDRRTLIFTDPKKLQQFIAKREAKGQQRNSQTTSNRDRDNAMDDVE